MSESKTINEVKKIVSELEDIGSSANATIDIIFSSLQTNSHWDAVDVGHCLVEKFPKKKFDIEYKIKTLVGETVILNVPVHTEKRGQERKEKGLKDIVLHPEVLQLQEMYDFLPPSFWIQVLNTAREYKKVGEKKIFPTIKN
jgi:hypothetical protein